MKKIVMNEKDLNNISRTNWQALNSMSEKQKLDNILISEIAVFSVVKSELFYQG
jgi:hypothetical protein